MIDLNESTVKTIQQTGIAVLVLAVLVWVLREGMLQMSEDRQIREAQQLRMANLLTATLEEAQKDRRDLTVMVRDLAKKIIKSQEQDEKVLALLEGNISELRTLRTTMIDRIDEFMDMSEGQTKALTRSIRKKHAPTP